MNTPKPSFPVAHRDGAGHLTPGYAAVLEASREATREPRDPVAFFEDDVRRDPLAEELGEAVVRTATGAEDDERETFEEGVTEETGGPFVETTGEQELAFDTDASNPEDATREPFPRT
jgi:hypothetical protein